MGNDWRREATAQDARKRRKSAPSWRSDESAGNMGTIKEKIENAGEAAKETAEKAGEKVKEGAGATAEKTADAAKKTGEAVKNAGQKLKEKSGA
jgi:hypothetical protein